MSSNFEQFSINDKSEIEKVWEAYHEKSKDYDKLLDDLEDYKSKVYQLESLSRNVKDNQKFLFQYEEMKKKIEKLQIQNAEIIKKEKLTRNKLDTEKENFDLSSKELQIKLKDAVESVEMMKQKMEMRDKQHLEQLNTFKEQMNTERITLNLYSLKLENRISELEKKLKEETDKYEVLEDQYITNISERNSLTVNHIQNSDDSNLLSQIQSLNEQLISVKERVLFQRKVIEKICKHPLIASALESFDMIPNSISSSTEEDTQESNTSVDLTSTQQDEKNILDENVDVLNQNNLNHFIEIPKDSETLSEAFKSLREKMKKREDFEIDKNPQPISEQKTPISKLPKRPLLASAFIDHKPTNHSQRSKPTKELPLNHPSKRPSMRAKIEPSHKNRSHIDYTCPVCQLRFDTNTSSHSIRCHVNGHFSDEEQDASIDEDLIKSHR